MVTAGARGSVRDHRVVLDRAVRWSLELCLLLCRHGTEIALVRSENSLIVRGRERALLGEAVVWLEVKLGQRDLLTETCLTSTTTTGVVLCLKMVLPAAKFPLTQPVDEEEEESEGEDGGDRGGYESQTEVAHLAFLVLPPVAEPLTTTVAGSHGQTSLWRTAEDRAAEHR